MIIRTDLELLRSRIQVPPGVQTATWVVVPAGNPNSTVPGPTDTILYAFLQPGTLEGVQPAAGGTTRSRVLPEEIAAGILPPSVLNGLPRDGAGRRVEGQAFDPSYFSLGSYRGVYALRLADGMLVCLQTQ